MLCENSPIYMLSPFSERIFDLNLEMVRPPTIAAESHGPATRCLREGQAWDSRWERMLFFSPPSPGSLKSDIKVFHCILWIVFTWCFFRCVAIVILSCAPPPAAGSGGIANWCKLQIANRGNSWNQIIVFEDVFHFEVFDPCIILRSQNSESISPMVLLIHTEDWVVPKFYDQLQPFFPASAVTNFGLPRLGSGQWLSSRMFLQEEKSCCLWPWEVRGSGGDTPPKHPETYTTLLKWS